MSDMPATLRGIYHPGDDLDGYHQCQVGALVVSVLLCIMRSSSCHVITRVPIYTIRLLHLSIVIYIAF